MRWGRQSGNHDRGIGHGSWAWVLAAASFAFGTWLGRDIGRTSEAVAAPKHEQACVEPEPPCYETRDANVKWLFGIVFFLLFSGLAIHGILAGYLRLMKGKAFPADGWEPVARARSATPPPGPRLQISAPMDLQIFRACEENELNSYGWVNRNAGVVRVPISRAMELVLQEGVPVGTNRLGPSSDQMMLQRTSEREAETKRGK